MMTKKQMNARIGAKKDLKDYRQGVRETPPTAYLCFCFDGEHLMWCDEYEGRAPCARKAHEVTALFDRWLDGEINRDQLVDTLRSMRTRTVGVRR